MCIIWDSILKYVKKKNKLSVLIEIVHINILALKSCPVESCVCIGYIYMEVGPNFISLCRMNENNNKCILFKYNV